MHGTYVHVQHHSWKEITSTHALITEAVSYRVIHSVFFLFFFLLTWYIARGPAMVDQGMAKLGVGNKEWEIPGPLSV